MLSCSARLWRLFLVPSHLAEGAAAEALSACIASPCVVGSAGLSSITGQGAAHRTATVLRNSAMCKLMSTSLSPCMTVQRRGQFTAPHGNREHEAFLHQYDPMDVLGLSKDCNVEDIDKAFEQRKAHYGPCGVAPSAKMVDRVFRAHEILKDPNSPYYLRAHSSQTERQRLQFQLLPKGKRRLIEAQVAILVCIAAVACMLIISLSLRPMQRSLRAATR